MDKNLEKSIFWERKCILDKYEKQENVVPQVLENLHIKNKVSLKMHTRVQVILKTNEEAVAQ